MRGCNCGTVHKDAHAPGCSGFAVEYYSLSGDNDALRAEVERLRAERDEARANLDRVAKTLAIVLGVSFESARDLPEKCSIGQMMPLQRAEKAEADNERLRGLIAEVEYGNRSPDGDSCPWCGMVARGQRYTCFANDPDHRDDCPAFSARGEVRR